MFPQYGLVLFKENVIVFFFGAGQVFFFWMADDFEDAVAEVFGVDAFWRVFVYRKPSGDVVGEQLQVFLHF